MIKAQDIYNQINRLTVVLIESGLCDDQNFPTKMRASHDVTEIGIPSKDYSVFLKGMRYVDMYKEAVTKRIFNIKMIDGGLLTLLYRFSGDNIIAHRLSFFPDPDLVSFQSDPELYSEDEIYADFLDQRIVTVPLRFDFDMNNSTPLKHPKSHLTIGQYENCRIPVSSALTPYQFVAFITRNFYHTTTLQVCLPVFKVKFDDSILPEECELVHIKTPMYRI